MKQRHLVIFALGLGLQGCGGGQTGGAPLDNPLASDPSIIGDDGQLDAGKIDDPGDILPGSTPSAVPDDAGNMPAEDCDTPPPNPGTTRAWRHQTSALIRSLGSANHRGRDLFVTPGQAQWVIGKFAYGVEDKDLKDEDIDIYLLRGCGTQWEPLGTARTTNENEHPSVEGVDDNGGRVYFEIPANKLLAPGRHRVRLVVAGDSSATDLFIEVVKAGTPIVVSDVDGTLTSSETAEFPALLSGNLPQPHPDAAAALQILAQKGYRPMYITARPEWLTGRTREFIRQHGFAPGIIHTTLGLTGAFGDPAARFKIGELDMLASKGLAPAWGIGNKASDTDAYEHAKIEPKSHRIFYQLTDTKYGGRRIESYTELLSELSGLPSAPQP